MKYFLFLFILSITAFSNQDRVNTETVTFDLSKELISSLDEAKNQITTHILNKQEPLTSDFFQESWISVIKTTNTFNKDVIVEIKEHQPIASLGKDRFITQQGKIISPKEKTKHMSLIKILGSDEEAHSLLDKAILLQNILNIREKPLIIDVGQAVPKEHPMYEELHQRDMKNMYRFWKKHIKGLKLEDLI